MEEKIKIGETTTPTIAKRLEYISACEVFAEHHENVATTCQKKIDDMKTKGYTMLFSPETQLRDDSLRQYMFYKTLRDKMIADLEKDFCMDNDFISYASGLMLVEDQFEPILSALQNEQNQQEPTRQVTKS